MELWKDIDGYEGIYQVSNMGRIRSLDRKVPSHHNCVVRVKGQIITPTRCTNGYYEAHLSANGKRKVFLLHRVVAKAFIPNPNGLPEVNHKDENIQNNCVENLEWCDSKYNANYGTRNRRCYEGNKKHFKPVLQFDKITGEFIKRWDCIEDAARELDIFDCQITRVCKGKNKSAGGFVWQYAEE